MNSNANLPWILKYFPKTIDDMVLSEEQCILFKNIIESGNLSNYSFFGSPGCGKTTLSKLLVDNLKCEYLFQPCSINGSIDMVKTIIKDFCDIIPRSKYKVIILDEADQLSKEAQMALRNIIVEAMDNCRFILTANYQDKIIDALKSRCTPIKIEFSTKDILKHCCKILKNENIKFDKETLLNFYDKVVIPKYPDIRAVIEHLQMMSTSGELVLLKNKESSSRSDIANYITENIKNIDIKKIREYTLSNEDKFSADYVKLAEELFNIYDDNAKIMMTIADSLWRMSFQLDKEIQFINMLLNIQIILNENKIH